MSQDRIIMRSSFIDEIKFNCDVSDAKYWGYFSICGLLMRYRDLYRSENGLKPWAKIKREEIVEWIHKKESRWPELEQTEYRDLTIDGKTHHPFDIFEINSILNKKGYVYGAGYGMYMKPTFFLAELSSIKEIFDHTVYSSDREIVRDLFTSAGMLQGRCIFLRIEPLTMLLWEKFSGLNGKKGMAIEDAFLHYGLSRKQKIDDAFEKKLEDMAYQYSDVLLRHELAESMEDVPEWREMLLTINNRKVEFFLRAIKDLISETSEYGPIKRIIVTKDRGALSLSIGLTEGYQKILYPEMNDEYHKFMRREDWKLIEDAREAGYARFVPLRKRIMEMYKNIGKDEFIVKINAEINNYLPQMPKGEQN